MTRVRVDGRTRPWRRRACSIALAAVVWCLAGGAARAQNDWQFPDPYFGAPRVRDPAAPWVQREYRREIGPQHYRPPAARPYAPDPRRNYRQRQRPIRSR